jgi:hypothetical protein
MENKSHATEIMQKTRIALENGEVSVAEQDESIRVSSCNKVVGGPWAIGGSSVISFFHV